MTRIRVTVEGEQGHIPGFWKLQIGLRGENKCMACLGDDVRNGMFIWGGVSGNRKVNWALL
jgi:hypothetical protein